LWTILTYTSNKVGHKKWNIFLISLMSHFLNLEGQGFFFFHIFSLKCLHFQLTIKFLLVEVWDLPYLLRAIVIWKLKKKFEHNLICVSKIH
jgi:hypothetical protein